ncbi:ADP-heptose--LPS heptosyltransferase [Adhaeribacter arboris]|uniref:ADP-heptose--LPS heptosyltransferase n=1 Tax=Adhaeribacter arboris TaxID=2072846 RepID=A0A2T2YFD6_9BACT|nr:glycosyltransferase family 9 protein [Adhaeribacter arboris]PSR54231.1 ADP-heptose--LPS heptosyltransferase [Adhaeribacter arboris]
MSQEVQEALTDLWMYHMRHGAFEEAWKKSDKDLKARVGQPCWHWPRHFQYIWDGTPLAGKRVLVRCYHGLGDTIQFIRYVPLLKEMAKEVMVWAQAPLIPLLETVPGINQLLPLHDGTPEVAYEVDVEIMELPHVFRTTLATIPAQSPYLHVDSIHLSPNNGLTKVGLVWKAGDWDERRSIPFSYLAPLAELSGIQLYILQADAPANGWDGKSGIYPGNFNLSDYARLVKGLDLMITVDSMPAHLAGALGIPVWTLLHLEADWRWMVNRNDSPWYPTMRLFRQTEASDWTGVIQRVANELKKISK